MQEARAFQGDIEAKGHDSLLALIPATPFYKTSFRDSLELAVNLIFLKEYLYNISNASLCSDLIPSSPRVSRKLVNAFIHYNQLDSAEVYRRETHLDVSIPYALAQRNVELLTHTEIKELLRRIRQVPSIYQHTESASHHP